MALCRPCRSDLKPLGHHEDLSCWGLAYVLHEISTAWSAANLAVLHNITEADALGPINAQASKAIDSAETFFKKWPLGDCLDDVLSARHRLTSPYTGPSAMSAIFGRLEEDIM